MEASQASEAGSIPVARSNRTSLWIQRFPAQPESVRGGVFGVLGLFSGWRGRVCGAVEESLTAADWSTGTSSQWVACPAEGGRVKKYGLASKGSAPRQKVRGLHQNVSSKRQMVYQSTSTCSFESTASYRSSLGEGKPTSPAQLGDWK